MSTRTGMFPPPNAPTPFQPGGMSPMQGAPNPFAPMPPMPLAGMPSPPMGGMPPPPPMAGGMPPPPMGPMGAGLGSSAGVIQSSNAPRRRIFGDYLESTLSGGQPRPSPPQAQMAPPVDPRYSQAPQFAMRPDSRQARPLMNGGIVQGYDGGGPVGHEHPHILYDEFDEDTGTYNYGQQTGLGVDDYKALMAEKVSQGSNFSGYDPAMGTYYFKGSPISSADYSAAVQAHRAANPDAAASADSVNVFDPDTNTYSIRNSATGDIGNYAMGTNYDDFLTEDVVEELPAVVAYSKQVQENRIGMGLPVNTSSAWELYKRGEHYSQYKKPETVAPEVITNEVVAPEEVISEEVVSQPITQITAAESGAGTAVGAGSYTADAVDSSEINPINYSQFTGDVGKFSNTGENFALYGPKLNIPTSVSQYMTDPVTGGLTTSYGPEMVATSPIGAIKMPARPVGIDIFNWLSTPTYGTMSSGINGDVSNMRMGGEASSPFSDSSVPRQTEIAGQPHMLAYINPEEENLLRGLGGSGNPGPGGIPAYYNPNEDYSRDTGRTTGSMREAEREGDGEDNDDFNQGDPFGTNDLLDSLGIPDFNPNKNFGGDGDGEDNLAVNPDTFIINPELIGPELVNPVTDPYVPELVTNEVIIPQDVNPVNDPYIPELVTNEVVIPEVITTDDVINLDPYVPELVTDEVIIPQVINPDPYVSRPVFPNSDDGNRYIGPNSTDEAIKKAVADNKAGNMDLANSSLAALAGRLSRGSDVMPARLYDINAVSSDFAVPPPKDTTYSDPDEIFDLNNPISLNASQVVGLNPRIDANGNMLPGRADTAADIEAGTLSARNLGPEVMNISPASPASPVNVNVGQSPVINSMFDLPVVGTNFPPASPSSNGLPSFLPDIIDPNTPPAPNMALPDGSAIPSNIQLENVVRPTSSDTKAGGIAATGLTYGDGSGYNNTMPSNEQSLYTGPKPTVDSGLGTDLGNVRPADAGLGRGSGFKSLEDIKKEISIVEGTSDEGGYDRLLGYQEKNFNVVPTKMTVQEVLDFQKRRGEDSYAAYSQTVNKKNNQFNKDGTPKISTPVGKYQVVGSTLQELVDDGVVKPNALFNKETQEKIGDYLINEKRGYNRKNGPDVLDGGISPEEFVKALGNEFQGIQLNDFSLSGNSIAPAVSPRVVERAVYDLNPGASDGEIANIKSQLDESVPVQGFGKFMANVGQSVFLGLGSEFVQGLVNKTEAQRTNIVAQHMSAINEGATPKYNEEGKYIGYDTSTMGTFADKVLAGDAKEFLPPTLPDLNYTVTQDDLDSLAATNKLYKDSNISTLKGKDLDGDGLPDTRTNLVSPVYGDGLNLGDQINMSGINSPSANEYASGFTDAEGNPVTDNSRFQQIYNVQSEAAEIDPNGSSTENGFITSDGREFVVTYDGKLLEVNDGVVGTGAGIFNNGLGTGTNVSNVYNLLDDEDEGDGDDDDSIVSEIDTGYTIDESGNRICNEAGYVYDVASDACIIAEELSGNGNASLNIGSGGSGNVRSFNDVLRSIETRPAKIAPISANIKPMAQGGMAGLNRAADNFLRALGG